jgi:hypothetical protein
MAATTVRNSPPRGPEPWQVTGCSVLGASHRRKGTENQDHIKYHDERGRAIVALADGHGSAKSFRSAVGSEFAVTVSYGFAWELLRAAPGGGDRFLSFVKDQVETDIPRRIAHGWTRQVDEHLEQNPFTEQELAVLEEQDGPESRRRVEQDGRLAYGSTLITAIALESFAVFWQIGDGDVLTVSSNREVSRPVPKDARLIANETTSLCSPNAWRMFRYAILGTPAPMIMLSTDGFANSFLDDGGFFKFGSDVSDIVVEQGLAKVAAYLPDWLAEITERGSGDDISLGIICRPNALLPAAAPPSSGSPKPSPATVPSRRPTEPPTVVAPSPRVPAGPPARPVLPTVTGQPRPQWSHPPTVAVPQGDLPTVVGPPLPQPPDPGEAFLAPPRADETDETEPANTRPGIKRFVPFLGSPKTKKKGPENPDQGQPDQPRGQPAAQEDARNRRDK